MKRNIFLTAIIFVIIILASAGCVQVNSSVDSKQKVQQEQMLNEMNNKIGMPNITNFFEKSISKQLLEMRDDPKLVTYSYIRNEMSGKFVFLSQTIGFGVPYSVQYTNPERIAKSSELPYSGNEVLPQADPNGLFMPESAAATWLIRVNQDGSLDPIYIEDNVTVSRTKLPKNLCEPWSLPANY